MPRTKFIVCLFLTFFCPGTTWSRPVSWSEAAPVPLEGRPNLYQQDAEEWQASQTKGQLHTLNYPVTVTASLVPLELLQKLLVDPYSNPLLQFVQKSFQKLSGLASFDDFEAFAGLIPISSENPYGIPEPETRGLASRYGTSFIETENGTGVSFSCAACHMSELFGVPIWGLQNRFPRGNEFFVNGKTAMKLVEPHLASLSLGLSEGTRKLLQSDKRTFTRVESKVPLLDGLDTSLAQVALSLSRRAADPSASFSPRFETFPRSERLRSERADSKPGNWWTLRYKNRWLLDGSVVSGNPIFTNILWNEIGRGTDLNELEAWLDRNQETINEFAAAIFAAEPPAYTDFFPAESIDLEQAKRGETTFNRSCARCHGVYEKAWNQPTAANLPLKEQLATSRVLYFAQTPVIDVGTDPLRYQGMRSLEQLNNLAISQKHGIIVRSQKGYVPPPLVGIWARWPYFHNNAAPTLCAVLSRAAERPAHYVAGEAIDPVRDFDSVCNGYPASDKAPSSWKKNPRRVYDTTRPGLSRSGHDEGIFLKAGREMLSPSEKMDLIVFLKTL